MADECAVNAASAQDAQPPSRAITFGHIMSSRHPQCPRRSLNPPLGVSVLFGVVAGRHGSTTSFGFRGQVAIGYTRLP